jgi:hypothetical protein
MKHDLKLTPGHVDRFGNVELPWKCTICNRYFRRRNDFECRKEQGFWDKNKMPCRVCGKMTAVLTYDETRRQVHKCPHGVYCP